MQRRVPQSQQQGDGGVGDFFRGDLPKKLAIMLVCMLETLIIPASGYRKIFAEFDASRTCQQPDGMCSLCTCCSTAGCTTILLRILEPSRIQLKSHESC